MKKSYIPINKGNYSMETPEREALFERYRAEGWEDEYKEYRLNWVKFAKDQIVSEYPLLVDIELSTICNLKCPMCYTLTEAFKEKVNSCFMDFNLFKKVVDEIAGKVPAVRLSLRGEATLHPRFLDCIVYCKEKGIGEVSFLTNGSKLDKGFFEQIMSAGADWITVSIDGVGKIYEDIRKPLRFMDTLQKIKDIKEVKDAAGRNKPVIKIQSVWPAIRENPTEYYRTFEPYVDLIAFNPLIDVFNKGSDVERIDDFSCPQLYQRLLIGSDGTVIMCTCDEENEHSVGNANEESVYSIWHGEKLNSVRELHKQNRYLKIPVCKKCCLPRATEDGEAVEIDGRDVLIRNYINERQEIGK